MFLRKVLCLLPSPGIRLNILVPRPAIFFPCPAQFDEFLVFQKKKGGWMSVAKTFFLHVCSELILHGIQLTFDIISTCGTSKVDIDVSSKVTCLEVVASVT